MWKRGSSLELEEAGDFPRWLPFLPVSWANHHLAFPAGADGGEKVEGSECAGALELDDKLLGFGSLALDCLFRLGVRRAGTRVRRLRRGFL